jgi:hypothetical protein
MDNDVTAEPERTGLDGLRDRSADPEPTLAPGTQAIAPVSADADPLSALPPPAYRNLLVISTRQTPNHVEATLRRVDCDTTNVGVVPVSAAPTEYDGPLWTTESVQPADLTGIAIRTSEAIQHLESGRGWVLLDALTLLLMYADESRVHRFTNALMRNLASKNVRGIYCLCPDAVDDQVAERFRALGTDEIDLDG